MTLVYYRPLPYTREGRKFSTLLFWDILFSLMVIDRKREKEKESRHFFIFLSMQVYFNLNNTTSRWWKNNNPNKFYIASLAWDEANVTQEYMLEFFCFFQRSWKKFEFFLMGFYAKKACSLTLALVNICTKRKKNDSTEIFYMDINNIVFSMLTCPLYS